MNCLKAVSKGFFLGGGGGGGKIFDFFKDLSDFFSYGIYFRFFDRDQFKRQSQSFNNIVKSYLSIHLTLLYLVLQTCMNFNLILCPLLS